MASHMEENIPQWKKDLIQRRKCQSKTIGSQLSNSTRLSSSSNSDLNKNDQDGQNISPRACSSSSSGDIRRGSGSSTADLVFERGSGSVDSLPSITGYNSQSQCTLNAATATVDTLNSEFLHVNEISDSFGDSSVLKQRANITKCANNKLNNMVEDRHTMASPHNGDGDSDSSEELQYGPGIVNKLKCKYLSLALRESSKARPSILSLRRATSLDNILDDGDNRSDIPNNNVLEAQPRIYQARTPDAPGVATKNRYRNASRGNESIKRARSVETIMRFDLRSGNSLTGTVGPPDDKINTMESFNEDVVIIEEGNVFIENEKTEDITDKSVISQQVPRERINKPKRLTSYMDETERPPPDVVKLTMRIFESSQARKIKPPKPTGDVAAKVATFKTILGNEKNNKKVHVNIPKPAISPKPFLSPEKTRQSPGLTPKNQFNFAPPGSPKKIITQIEKEIERERSLSPIPRKIGLEIIGKRPASPVLLRNEIESPVNSKPSTPVLEIPKSLDKIDLLSNPTTPTSPVIVKQIAEQFLKQELIDPPKILSSPEPVKSSHLSQSVDSPVTNLTKQIAKLSINSPISPLVNDNKVSKSDSEEESEEPGNKTISQKSLENISKAGMTMQFNFNSVSSKSHLPGIQPEVNGKKSDITNSKNSENIPIGVIRPLVSNQSKNNTVLTNREIEKNLINRVKTLEQPVSKVVVSVVNNKTPEPSAVLSLGNNKSVSTENGKSGAKKTWHQQSNNTMVFNFSDRKEVPDYIENDGIILRSKREIPKPNDSGFILLGGVQQDSSSDWDDDVDSEWAGPPSPCNVSFENDNVIINGRSNLAGTKPRATKLQIHFDDASTSIFEYPSESSLLEEAVMATLNSSPGLSSTPMGNTPLANYTPSKVGINNHFELGITRTAPETQTTSSTNNHTSAIQQEPQSQIMQNGNSSSTSEEPESLQYLKPATDEQTISWSHETKSTDLLF